MKNIPLFLSGCLKYRWHIINTVLWLGITAFLSYGYGMAVLAVWFFIFWLIWTLFYFFQSIGKGKLKWRIFVVRFAVWAIFWASVVAVHHHHVQEARAIANQAVAQIEAYHAQHGHYPDPKKLPENFRLPERPRMRYFAPEGRQEHFLMYKDPIMLMDWHIYEFQTKTWRYQPD